MPIEKPNKNTLAVYLQALAESRFAISAYMATANKDGGIN
jgi:hypothetical protein